MFRIQSQLPGQAKRAMQVLGWITCARRELGTLELQHGLAVEQGTTELDPDNIPQLDHLVSICAGLVTVNEEAGTVRLVHSTAQEYLKSTHHSWFPDIQKELMNTCVSYLSYKAFEEGPRRETKTYEHWIRQMRSAYPFLVYAARHWAFHARQAPVDETLLEFLRNTPLLITPHDVSATSRRSMYPCPRRTLHMIAFFGLEQAAVPLLQEYDIEERDDFGYTPLLQSCESQHWNVARLLIEKGAHVNAANHSGETPLILASSDAATVNLLLEHGAKAYCVSHDGTTPLTGSVPNFELTDQLLGKGATLNTTYNTSIDPLHLALKAKIEKRDIRTIKLLLKHGARLDGDEFFDTPLATALKNDYLEAAKLLIDHDAYLDLSLRQKCMDFGHAIDHSARHDWDLTLIKLLLTKGININDIIPLLRNTPLHHLLTFANYSQEAAKLFIEKGADANNSDRTGTVPLIRAIRANDIDSATLIIEHGADVNHSDRHGWTPLSVALAKGWEEMAELLLSRGAELNRPGARGRTTPLHYAAERGPMYSFTFLIKHGADVHAQSLDTGETPLHVVDDLEKAQILIEHEADVNASKTDGSTPLHRAAQWGNLEMVKLLVDKGSRVNAQTLEGKTPPHKACSWNNLEMVKFLIEQGADVNAPKADGHTPLHKAVKRVNLRVVKFLIENGGDVNAPTAEGTTPLSLAQRSGNQELINLCANPQAGRVEELQEVETAPTS